MSTIVTINASDVIANSRADINTNFSNLNTDKIETSVIDTDTALTANSDSKIPSQKAVKAYADALGQQTYLVPTGAILPYGGSSAPSNFLLCDGTAVSRSTYATLFGIVSTSFGAGDGSTTFNLPDLRSSVPLGKGQKTRTMTFAGDTAVDPSTDEITVTSNNWLITGQAVALTGAGLPTGLSATTYYVIRSSATVIKLASSLANAQNGTVVDITADGSGTCTFTQTLTDRTLGTTGGEETHAMSSTELLAHTHSFSGVVGQSSNSSSVPAYSSAGGNTKQNETFASNGGNAGMNIMNPYVVVNYIIKT